MYFCARTITVPSRFGNLSALYTTGEREAIRSTFFPKRIDEHNGMHSRFFLSKRFLVAGGQYKHYRQGSTRIDLPRNLVSFAMVHNETHAKRFRRHDDTTVGGSVAISSPHRTFLRQYLIYSRRKKKGKKTIAPVKRSIVLRE